MNDKINSSPLAEAVTRRQAIAGIAVAMGGLTAVSSTFADTTNETPAAAKLPRTSLHYEADFAGTPQRIYDVLLDAKQFAAATGSPAEIDPKEGGVFSMFGARIVGRNIELIPGQRIVQAWRPTHWDAGIYSIVKFEFHERGSKTHMILDHTGFPVEEADHLDSGWKAHYLDPLAKYLV
jgi:activator of HSP90 ATPase